MQTGQGLGGAYRDKLGSIYFILPEKDGHKNAELAVQQRSHREGKEAGQSLPLFGLPEAEGSTDRGRARTNGGPCAEEPCGTRQDPLLLSPVHVQVYHPAPDEPSCEPLFKTPGESTGDECDEPSGVDGGQPSALPDWRDRPLEVHPGGKSTLLLEEAGRGAVSSNHSGRTDAGSRS